MEVMIKIQDRLDDTQQMVQALANLAGNNQLQNITGEDVAIILDIINEKLNLIKSIVN